MHAASDRIRFAHDAHSGIEAIRARFTGHAYDLHRHEQWLVGVTDFGLQEFSCRGVRQRSTRERIILIEPDEAHDGDAVTPEGFGYSMLYLPQAWVASGLDASDGVGFRTTLNDDALLGGAIRRACGQLASEPDRLAVDASLDAVLSLLRPHLVRTPMPAHVSRDTAVAQRARDYLHDAMADATGADALAHAVGAPDRFQLARVFRAAYGTSPHAYRLQIRLVRARRLLASGAPPIDVAAACGFADQSHLGRHFRRAYGLTPAAYRAFCTGVPDKGSLRS